jgi:hypothetical protein
MTFTTWPLYPLGKTLWYPEEGRLGTADLDAVEEI